MMKEIMKKLLIPILFFAAAMTAYAHCGSCAADDSHGKAAKAEQSCDGDKAAKGDKSCCGKCDGDKAAKGEKSCCGKCGGDKAAKGEKSCCGKCGGDKAAKKEIPLPKMACCPAES